MSRVAAHAMTPEGMRRAIAAGVDSIEHGLYLEEETFRLMAVKGIAYVPTLLVYELWRDAKIFGAITPENRLKLTNTVREHAECCTMYARRASSCRRWACGVRMPEPR